ncbi:minor tail protein [Mycobacterium phage Venti]|nr:minor tail protein [Mycobacterium phage Venti]
MPRVENIGDYLDLAEIQRKLLSHNPHEVMQAARQVAEVDANPPGEVSCTVRYNTYKLAGEASNRKSLAVSWPRLTVPTGKLVLDGDDGLADVVLNCHETVVPVVVDCGPLRWSGRVDVAHDKFGDPNEPDTIECELIHDKVWLTRVVAFPWWFMPLQWQGPPTRGVAFGNAISVIKYLFASQFMRVQLGLWEFVNNLLSLNLDWRAMFGSLLMQNPGEELDLRDIVQMATTPVYVVPSAGWNDTSPFISLNWRMDELLQLVTKTCEDNGLTIEVYLWEPGMPQPDPFAEATNLLRIPTIVVDVKDRMQVTGITGTAVDGLQRTFVDLLGSMFGEALKPFLDPNNEAAYAPDGVNIAPVLGVHAIKPWCVFNADHPRSGVRGVVSHHHPIAWRTITGGKSPAWLNSLVDATLAWLIDMITIVLGVTGVPGTILDGAFHDIAFAFQQTDNFDRRLKLGLYGLPEVFIPTGSGSYTLEAFFQQKSAQYDTRGYVSGQLIVDNCFPYELGRDTFPGALATFIRRGRVVTDFIENATLIENRGEATQLQFQIGDGKAEEAPAAKLQRRFGDLQAGVNIALMAS